ncbi:LacI family transcriptional regulator [Streptosporangium becharense]|uniref:LacI family transcriptional regulator n=1 Tax=Streptosporangium becharense TaxID=1816182 RepID=A0A7W9IBR2_9ACTN|nr:LacI family DNA-binding transcriptional regulator [Streptosporangium becharense]MBB2914181.1 LacI family transcriptional regulator [Streptosporangium becharense]MBB5817208.1 LacI family transcriptional regulator [Streptosporangium becharense]
MPGPDKPPTIYDVARAAGVATSTVSRAFSRPGRVNADTAARIRRVAAELGYRVDPLASAPPTGRTSMLALVVSDVTNPVYAEIIRGAESAAAEAGYVLLLIDAQESDRLERDSLERALPGVEGVVLAGTRMSDSAIRVAAKQRPVALLNRHVTDVPSIVHDNLRGMRLTAEHLYERGHRKLTYVAGPDASWANGMRWRCLREAAAELGQRVRRLGPFAPTLADGWEAANALLCDPPTAVVAYNDQLAIGLVLALQAGGVRVPGDVSVIGFDDIFPARIVTPPLTTVAAPLRAQGRTAVKALLAWRGGSASLAGRSTTLPVRLVVRGSTARRRSHRARSG